MSIFKNDKKIFLVILLGGLIIVFALMFFLWNDLNFSTSEKIQSDKWAQIGDFIGGVVGTIWALAGMLLFYSALKEQREDLEINKETLVLQVKALNQQVEEFRLQRKELESSRKVYEQQNKTIRVQQFESHFYSILDVYLKIKDSLNSHDVKSDFFKTIYSELKVDFQSNDDVKKHHIEMIDNYLKLFNKHRGSLPQFFKLLYRLMKTIDTNIYLSESQKTQYAKILRSQLTDYEQLIIQYNSYSQYGIKARPLILKYNFLKHVPLFQKGEFECFSKIHKELNLIRFTENLSHFLITNIKNAFDISNQQEEFVEKEDLFKCIVSLKLEDNFKFEIRCEKNIFDNGIILSDQQFVNLVYNIICEKIIFTTYTAVEKVKVLSRINETEEGKKFSFDIDIEDGLVLNLMQDN